MWHNKHNNLFSRISPGKVPRPPLVHTYSSDFFFSSLIRPQPVEAAKQKPSPLGNTRSQHEPASSFVRQRCYLVKSAGLRDETTALQSTATRRWLRLKWCWRTLPAVSLFPPMSLKKIKEDCNSPTAEHLFIINSLGRAHCFMCENSPYITAALKTRACLWVCVCVCVSGGEGDFIDIGCAVEIWWQQLNTKYSALPINLRRRRLPT